VSSKRSPQTAAKRAREQQVREKRERKAAKKQAAILARKNGTSEDGTEATELNDDAVQDGTEESGATVASPDGSPDLGEAAEPDPAPAAGEA
jgi:hypothetical protein